MNPTHSARLIHHSTQVSVHHPWMTPDAAPRTLVPATVVRKAKPLAWSVRSAANGFENRAMRRLSRTTSTT